MKTRILIVLSLLLSLCSCTDSENPVYEYVTAKNGINMKISVDKLSEKAGAKGTSKGIDIESVISGLFPSLSGTRKNGPFGLPGLDMSELLCIGNYYAATQDTEFITICRLSGKKTFTDFLKKEGAVYVDKINGCEVYREEGAEIVIDKDVVFFSELSAQEIILMTRTWKANAEKEPLPEKMMELLKSDADYVIVGKTKRLLDSPLFADPTSALFLASIYPEEISSGYLAVKVDIDGPEMNLETLAYNKEGGEVPTIFGDSRPDTDLLKYATADDNIVGCGNLESLLTTLPDELQNKKSGISNEASAVLKSFSGLIDGNVMIAAQTPPDNTTQSIDNLHITVAFGCKPGKAAAFADMLNDKLAGMGITGTTDGDMRVYDLQGGKMYLANLGNNVVLSLNRVPAAGGTIKFNKDIFTKNPATVAVDAPSGALPFMGAKLPEGLDMRFSFTSKGLGVKAKLKGTDANFLEVMLNAINH